MEYTSTPVRTVLNEYSKYQMIGDLISDLLVFIGPIGECIEKRL